MNSCLAWFAAFVERWKLLDEGVRAFGPMAVPLFKLGRVLINRDW
jgi:hypothetical protein